MGPATLVLLHSPLTGAAAWGRLPDALRAAGHRVLAPDVTDDDRPPYAQRYVMAVAAGLHDPPPEPPVVLVGHSGAGYLLPQVGFARRAARRRVAGYLFCDAGLPRPAGPGGPPTRLALLHDEDEAAAHELEELLLAGGRFPTWGDAELSGQVPDPAARAALVASLRPRGLDFFTEPLPFPGDWPDAPCGYLRTSPAYDGPARVARHRGWPVVERDAGHFAALADPAGTADALLTVLADVTP